MTLSCLACFLLIRASVAPAVAPPTADEAKKKMVQEELEKFAGMWEILTTGKTGPARFVVLRKDGRYSTYDKDGKELRMGTFELDPTAKPKVFDHRSLALKEAGGDALGIYHLDGDRLKLCVAKQGQWKDGKWDGPPRPSELKDSDGCAVIELKRVKK
jgi:uncharacterized protein (TIGR03067 family)